MDKEAKYDAETGFLIPSQQVRIAAGFAKLALELDEAGRSWEVKGNPDSPGVVLTIPAANRHAEALRNAAKACVELQKAVMGG